MSRKPQPREQVNEAKRTARVHQGRNLATPSSSPDRTVTVRVVLVRLPEDMLAEIDGLLKQRRVKVSRNTWLLEAIVEKIRSEQRRVKVSRNTRLLEALVEKTQREKG